MEVNLQYLPLEGIEADAVVLVAFEGQKDTRAGLEQWFESGEITGKSL